MLLVLVFSVIIGFASADYDVKLNNNGPAIIGANITFTAELFYSGHKASGLYKYKWRDNLYPQNQGEFEGNAESQWTVHYSAEHYKPGRYEVELFVYLTTVPFIDWSVCNKRSFFFLSDMLVGELKSSQNTSVLNSAYVSNASEVTHEVLLNPPDAEYLKNNASSVITYWFVDCLPVGNSTDLKFHHNYTVADVSYSITALVVASHLPATNSLTHNITSPVIDTSTEVVILNSSSTPSELKSRNSTTSEDNTKFSYLTVNNATINDIPPPPFSCSSRNITLRKNNYSYGVFTSKIKVKAPVENLEIQGIKWLKHGDMLNLQIYCNGSAPFTFCVNYTEGYYNVTGNETCTYFIEQSATCSFPVNYYFSNSAHYTVLLIIFNDVNKRILAIGTDVYEVSKHPQLSVIIIPISASIIAVVLIIFGIAYYIQNRNRFIIEVAEFDFSNPNDMEYKTFRERLTEAVHNAFYKTEDFSEQDSYNETPTNKRYGSMP